jgi:hypothetical protein
MSGQQLFHSSRFDPRRTSLLRWFFVLNTEMPAIREFAGNSLMRINRMKPVYIMVGGFLGTGKTSTISRLARHYMEQGKKVGIVKAKQGFALDDLLMDLIRRLYARLLSASDEAAHLKVTGLCDASYAVANVVSNQTGPELSLASGTITTTANVVVNARVAIDPAELETMVREVLSTAAAAIGASQTVVSLQSFRPGRPVPTHRL